MRCHEARTRMNGIPDHDTELLEHLRTCADCRRLGEAESKLTHALNTFAKADPGETTPFVMLRQTIESRVPATSRKDNHVMSSLVNQFKVHPRLSVSLALAVAMFLIVSLVPFSYERISGYSASISVPRTGASELRIEDIHAALGVLGHDQLGVGIEQTPEATIYQLDRFVTRAAAREAASAVRILAGQSGTISVAPIFETVSGSLYAQVRDRIITINIDGAGKTDAQIESEITTKLAENGLNGANVSVSTEAGGMRKITISHESHAGVDSSRLQINMQQSPGTAPLNIHLINDSTMTDAELKAAIEAKLTSEGATDVNVTVTTGSDGKRNVNVQAKRK